MDRSKKHSDRYVASKLYRIIHLLLYNTRRSDRDTISKILVETGYWLRDEGYPARLLNGEE